MAEQPLEIIDNQAEHRYEARVEGGLARLDYRHGTGVIVLVHTEVPPESRGRGIGARLARHALDRAREEQVRVVATCPFVRRWIEKHPEYADLVHRGAFSMDD